MNTCLDVRDGTHDTPKYFLSGYPLVTSKNLKNGEIDFSNIKYISEEDYLKINQRSKVDVDDILFAMIGSIGNPVLVTKEPAYSIKNMALFKKIKNGISSNYLLQYLLYSQEKMKKDASGGVQSFVSLNYLRNYLIPIPPFQEQLRIVDCMRKMNPLINEYNIKERELYILNNEINEKLKKSILQYAIEGKLVEQNPDDEPASVLLEHIREEKQKLVKEGKIKKDKNESIIFRRDNSYYEKLNGIEYCIDEEIPFEIPSSWTWCRLKTISSIKGGKRIPTGKSLTKSITNHIYIRVSDMHNGTILDNDVHYIDEDIYKIISQYTISKNDLYITCAGTIGRIGKIPPMFDGANLTENADKIEFKLLEKNWLYYFLNSPYIQNQITQSTTKVGQPKLAIKRIEMLLIPLVPKEEQYRISKSIDNIFNKYLK